MGSGPILPNVGRIRPGVVTPRLGAGAARAEPKGGSMTVALSAIPGLTSSRVLKRPFYFQCAPIDNMPQDYTWQWDDYVTIDATTHSNPTAIANATYGFSSLFVDSDHRFVLVRNFDVLKLVRELKKIGDTMRPFQLQFGQPALWEEWDVVDAVTLRSLHVEERHPEIDARYFTVSFNSYADAPALNSLPIPEAMQSASVGSGSATSSTPQRAGSLVLLDSSVLPSTLNTLSKISKVYYHDPGFWPVVAKASGLETVSANQNLVETVGAQSPPARIVVPELRPTGIF